MQHADRTREAYVVRPHDDHFAPYAAQIGQGVARSKSAAIDDELGLGRLRRQLDAEA